MVDYGMGNRRSVVKAFDRIGCSVLASADHRELRQADGLIVPGVGAFPAAMRRLRALGLDELVIERAHAGVPVIGLCLGMQLLFDGSEEHEGSAGLGLLPGRIVKLDAGSLKLPHIGWNSVSWQRPSPLHDGLPDPAAFYHVHSFVQRGNVYGAQCHPEKSSTHGLALLRNFVAICATVPATS